MLAPLALVSGLAALLGSQIIGIRDASKEARRLQEYCNTKDYRPKNIELEYNIAYDNYIRIKKGCDEIDKKMMEELKQYSICDPKFDECFNKYWNLKAEKYGGSYDESYKKEAIRIANREVERQGYKPCIKPIFIGVFWEKGSQMAKSYIREIERMTQFT